MLQPKGGAFEWAALLVLLSGFAYALSMIAARVLGGRETGAALAFWGNAVFLALALLLSAVFGTGAFEGASHPSLAFLTRGWVMPTAFDLGLMVATGIVAAVGRIEQIEPLGADPDFGIRIVVEKHLIHASVDGPYVVFGKHSPRDAGLVADDNRCVAEATTASHRRCRTCRAGSWTCC